MVDHPTPDDRPERQHEGHARTREDATLAEQVIDQRTVHDGEDEELLKREREKRGAAGGG